MEDEVKTVEKIDDVLQAWQEAFEDYNNHLENCNPAYGIY